MRKINWKSCEVARRDYTTGSGGLRAAAAMTDKLAQRVSLKEKLAAYKAQVSYKKEVYG